ncbi:protein FAM8A1 [Chrysoperla carnea]|uniref:protein FAM8A1 n=1 Tax=Chrysoperla carnea TaxID=189513 RepID=UPI001D073185|nr:protein FAM8A1 [Chrysoperla carnea]
MSNKVIDNTKIVNNNNFKTNDEYFEALRIWLDNYNRWYEINRLFTCLSHVNTLLNNYNHINNSSNYSIPPGLLPNNNDVRRRTNRFGVRAAANGAAGFLFNNNVNDNNNNEQMQQQSLRCQIPPIWKRMVAETIDFIILFFIKFFFTGLLVNTFNILPLKKYDFETIHKTLSDGNANDAIDMTVDIFIFEILHRTIVCTFETYFLSGHRDGHGGATPGKLFMNLRVVHATQIHHLVNVRNNNMIVVLISPGTNLGYLVAFIRSFIKNLIILLLFPMCFIIYFFSYNRTGYDFICNSCVVELVPQQLIHNNNNRNRVN